jgi:hypothetical protein
VIARGPEIIRRLRVVSQLRHFFLEMRRGTRAAYEAGTFPYEPYYDIRSDPEYWRRLKADKEKDIHTP